MPKLFILGAGFSKALSSKMPTLWDLSQKAIDWDELPIKRPQYLGFSEDVEQLLTYLYQEMPWKSPQEAHLDKAAFLTIAQQISTFIKKCEDEAFRQKPPNWAVDFVDYLHQTKSVVATLNYDTVIERLAKRIENLPKGMSGIGESLLYQLPITPLLLRTSGTYAEEQVDTFRLLKLHGSTNRYSSGDDAIAGQQVYYDSLSYLTDAYISREFASTAHVNRKDLIPLIVPPVAEKSTFYKTRLIRILWSDFREAIEAASEIYCIGYSLPKTDLTMNLFLRSTAGIGKTVYVVNSAPNDVATQLKESYQQVFQNCTIDDRYLGRQEAVQEMVEDLSQQ